jgi:two-component system, chemotaxis family, chemotaxis protein CheY
VRVLICDDERGVRWVLNRVLTRELNWTVVECEDGEQALKVLLNGEGIDLLLLDIHMPVLNGIETLKAIRETEALADLRVVILTGDRKTETVLQLRELGVSDYILKPTTANGLVQKLKRFTVNESAAATEVESAKPA